VATFVIMGNAFSYCQVMCGGIIGMKNVVFINETSHFKSTFGKLLNIILQKINRKMRISRFNSLLFKPYFCGAAVPDNEDIRFVFFDSNAQARDESFLKYLVKKYKAKLVLYVMNPTSSMMLNPRFYSKIYDLVFTVFARDAALYGWHGCNHLYTKMPDDEPAGTRGDGADVFFAGRAKNRLQDILCTYEFLVNRKIRCDFNIVDVAKKEQRYADDITYNQWLPYKEVIRRMRRSKCVLEILQYPGAGPTLRMVEAVVYNKKIITNDAAAPAHPFYDERFVQVFDAPENIRLSFIKEDSEPDYHYRGEYSAKNFLADIEEHLAVGNTLPGKG